MTSAAKLESIFTQFTNTRSLKAVINTIDYQQHSQSKLEAPDKARPFRKTTD